jgi:hypothetical protein
MTAGQLQITGRIAWASHHDDGSLDLSLAVVEGDRLVWQRVTLLDAAREGLRPLDCNTAAGDQVTLAGHFEEITVVDPDDGSIETEPYFILRSLSLDPVRTLWDVPEPLRSALWSGVSPAIDDRATILAARPEFLSAQGLARR